MNGVPRLWTVSPGLVKPPFGPSRCDRRGLAASFCQLSRCSRNWQRVLAMEDLLKFLFIIPTVSTLRTFKLDAKMGERWGTEGGEGIFN